MSYLHKMLIPKVLLTSSSRLVMSGSIDNCLVFHKCFENGSAETNMPRCETKVLILIYYLTRYFNPTFLKMILGSSLALL